MDPLAKEVLGDLDQQREEGDLDIIDSQESVDRDSLRTGKATREAAGVLVAVAGRGRERSLGGLDRVCGLTRAFGLLYDMCGSEAACLQGFQKT